MKHGLIMRTILWGVFLVSFPAAAQQVCACSGGISSYPAGTEPNCDASTRGTVIISQGSVGQSDLVKVCLRNALGRYAWTLPAQQSTATYANSRLIGGCPIFPDNNVWNSRADSLPVDPGSSAIIQTYSSARVGADPAMAINLADSSTPRFPVSFSYQAESDPGPYALTGDMLVEGYAVNATFPISGGPYNSDAHVLVIRTDECKLYEIFAMLSAGPPYQAGSGAVFDLTGNGLRPDGWSSADAAGLPVWPGVLTYSELYGSGEIQHMLRFTVNATRNSYVWPARHAASTNGSASVPPMGSRWRLKSSFDETTCQADENAGQAFPPEVQKLIRGLKHYGMILADNGAAIRLQTDTDPRWGDPSSSSSPEWNFNGWTHCIRGSDFEVVNASGIMVNANSATVAQ